MELEQAQKRVEELRAVIEKNNRLYYDQDAPELEDFEYDALTRELKALEAEARFLRAFLAFDLVRYWGDVPFKTSYSSSYESAFGERVDREVT